MNKPIYALSGYAEWFWLMAKNYKDVENRNWSITRYIKEPLPIRIYLHASKTKTPWDEYKFITETMNKSQYNVFTLTDFDALRGKIIGEITIIGQVIESDSK